MRGALDELSEINNKHGPLQFFTSDENIKKRIALFSEESRMKLEKFAELWSTRLTEKGFLIRCKPEDVLESALCQRGRLNRKNGTSVQEYVINNALNG